MRMFFHAVALGFVCSQATAQCSLPTLLNGDFEAGTAHWTLSGFVCNSGGIDSGHTNLGLYINDCGFASDPCITTTISNLCVNNKYTLTFKAMAGFDYNYLNNDSLAVRINGTLVLSQNEQCLVGQWRIFEIPFVASTTTAELQICAETNGTDAAWTVDDFVIRRGNAVCPSDMNGDGSVDGDDVILFFERWDVGC